VKLPGHPDRTGQGRAKGHLPANPLVFSGLRLPSARDFGEPLGLSSGRKLRRSPYVEALGAVGAVKGRGKEELKNSY